MVSLSTGAIVMIVSGVMIVLIFGIIIGVLLNSLTYSKIVKSDKGIIFLDDEIIDDFKQQFKESIKPFNETVELIQPDYLNDIVKVNINKESINKKLTVLSDKIDDDISVAIKSVTENIEIPKLAPIKIELDVPTQKVQSTKFSNKHLYDIVPDKYIDLLLKSLNELTYNNGIIKYNGNINITLNTKNSDEFWFLCVTKEEEKCYSFNIKQKKIIFDICNYMKFKRNEPISESFNFIKSRIQ